MNADEQRARDLLAAEYERVGWAGTAIAIRKGRDDVLSNGEHAAIRAIMAALAADAGEVG